MFKIENEKYIFKNGKENYKLAVEQAISCKDFILDNDEDELVTDTNSNSCYNCLFRKWTKESFICLKK